MGRLSNQYQQHLLLCTGSTKCLEKTPITTKHSSRLESTYFLWFLFIFLSHTNCYQPQFFCSKHINPLHDKKLINHSCFLPNQDHTTRSQFIISKFTRKKLYINNHNQFNKSSLRITTQQSSHSQQHYNIQYTTMQTQ